VPLVLALSLLVWVDTRGWVVYRAKRMGRDGEPFSRLKFRTMMPEAEDKLRQMFEEDPKVRAEYLTYHKVRDDPRETRVGPCCARRAWTSCRSYGTFCTGR